MADPQGDPSGNQQPMLSTVYQELCSSYRATDDFRAKLLGFLPLASGAGIFLLLGSGFSEEKTLFLLPIGLFGAGATLGLFVLELRGIQKCHGYILAGMRVEELLDVEHHFTKIPKELTISRQDSNDPNGSSGGSDSLYWWPTGNATTIGTFMAARLIYTTVFAGWMFVALLGLFTIISTFQGASAKQIEVDIVMAAVGFALLSGVAFLQRSGKYVDEINKISIQIGETIKSLRG